VGGNLMKVLFLGGDRRQLEIINDLYKHNHNIDVVGYQNIELPKSINKKDVYELMMHEYQAVFFPVNGVQDNNIVTASYSDKTIILPDSLLVGTKKCSLIFTGIMTPNLNKMLDRAHKKAIVLMNDNDIKRENSIPTVEGIIGDLVFNTDHTINKSNILVFGYGNVGRELVDKLISFGANVMVGVISESDYKKLKSKSIKALYTTDKIGMASMIKNNDTIINTVPEMILNKDYLRIVKPDAYILDIASSPHGVDFKTASELNIKNKLWLGIPSDVAPKTAGLILTKKINSIMEGVRI
jgi:dipicolinate synthase subunit A